ncbi:MAG: S-layer homology domain-containing protein [Pseudothermotoga sp.]|uniref:S-layer homology domain-containing protein n=1 Tax=Pseudothermotoga sp. TaxID=2033661 RepID=UPI000AE44E6A|nr:S-layer homology domain-containing protein [Pseudothermotoga sp.]
MKKLFLTVVAVVVAVGVFASGMFPDIPEHHWAYEYVKHLKDKGIVIGYPDGTFKGDRNITRYEEATMISRLIGLIETEIVGPYISDVLKVLDAISVKLGSTISKVEDLEKKVTELAAASKVEELSKSLESLKQTVNIHDKDVIKLYEAIANLQKKHEEDIAKLSSAFESKLADHAAACEDAISKIESKIADLEGKILALEPVKNIVKDLTSYTRAQSNRISALEAQVGDLSSMLDNAVKNLGYVSIKLDRLSEKVDKIETRVSANEEAIANLTAKVAANEGAIADLNAKVAANKEAINAEAKKLEGLAGKVDEFMAMHEEQIDYVLDELDSVNTQLSELRDGLFAVRTDTEERFTQVESTIDSVKAELLSKIEELQKANMALTGAVIGAIIIAVAAMIVGAM